MKKKILFFDKMAHPTKKVVLIGNEGVGKTHLCYSLVDVERPNRIEPTLGLDVRPICLGNKFFNLWDISGNSRLWNNIISRQYLAKADAIIIVKSAIEGVGKSEEEWLEICQGHEIFIVDERPNVEDVKDIINSL